MDDLQCDTELNCDVAIVEAVLNLVINGWPSILMEKLAGMTDMELEVLNLVINGWPSILVLFWWMPVLIVFYVLNLVINGWPSILFYRSSDSSISW